MIVVYSSNTGHARAYADLLGKALGLTVYPLNGGAYPAGADAIYLGWVRAGEVVGFKRAAAKLHVAALCGVGMGGPGLQQVEDIKKRHHLTERPPVFYLQGGFEMDRLKGVYRWMMKMLSKGMVEKLSAKNDRTPEEEDMLDLVKNGGSRVSEKALEPIVQWARAHMGGQGDGV